MFSLRNLVVLAFGLHVASGHSHYQTMIPNGHRVPDPCDPQSLWHGVGHRRPPGKGPRNPFGLAFANNNHVSAFCIMYGITLVVRRAIQSINSCLRLSAVRPLALLFTFRPIEADIAR